MSRPKSSWESVATPEMFCLDVLCLIWLTRSYFTKKNWRKHVKLVKTNSYTHRYKYTERYFIQIHIRLFTSVSVKTFKPTSCFSALCWLSLEFQWNTWRFVVKTWQKFGGGGEYFILVHSRTLQSLFVMNYFTQAVKQNPSSTASEKPTPSRSGPVKKENIGAQYRHHPLRARRRPPKGMYLAQADITALSSSHDAGVLSVRQLDTHLVSLKRQVSFHTRHTRRSVNPFRLFMKKWEQLISYLLWMSFGMASVCRNIQTRLV